MQRVQIITGVERRRRFTDEEKKAILAELREPGMSMLKLAKKYQVSTSLLYTWRNTFEGEIRRHDAGEFVQMIPPDRKPLSPKVDVIRAQVGTHLVVEFPVDIHPGTVTTILRGLLGVSHEGN
jgi:transposase